MKLKILLASCALWLTACANLEVNPDAASDLVDVVTGEKSLSDQEVEPSALPTSDDYDPVPDDPYYAPIRPGREPEPVVVTGSLFNSDTSRSLYSYIPNFALGDTITVVLDEEAKATKSANSTLEKSTNYTLEPITVPGGDLEILGKIVELDIKQDNDFDGAADANQKHSLSGRITVTVVDVLNNGNLVVRGEKWLVINNGKEFIRFTGIVRPKDVALDNSIGSYQVANARIEFSGTGAQAEAQKQGWISSFLSGESWPF
ncbi:flagellar basal body L-ring protein FlgH [Neiella marina]|uniref:Flagellar L-ring protein n=1 Tax=Neiella holothuriorum TaxID=2870530 RepID=A0ABS7EIU5_9GAMM|nr:flagellar basal body L-ring protein FlgH [Neiella holothuriorum]MBW8192140.1 flagellar basal body L-ring protein FlgH [Neiella holothuriorum]